MEVYCAQQQLCRLRQHVASPSSSAAAMAGALEGAARVYEHVESLVRFACAAQVEEELEESVALLDACAAARDGLRAMRTCALDLEVAVRRRDSAGAQSAARTHARLAKKTRADVKKQQRWRLCPRHERQAPHDDGHSLREARRVTVAVLELVVATLSRRIALAGSRSASKWSTCVARAFRKTIRVACEDAEEIATALYSSSKDLHDDETASRAQKELRALGDTIQRLEDGSELLFRRLMQFRVHLLNMCSL